MTPTKNALGLILKTPLMGKYNVVFGLSFCDIWKATKPPSEKEMPIDIIVLDVAFLYYHKDDKFECLEPCFPKLSIPRTEVAAACEIPYEIASKIRQIDKTLQAAKELAE